MVSEKLRKIDDKIKTVDSVSHKRKQNIFFDYTFCLADENNPFSIEQFLDKLRYFNNQLKVNFGFGYILREESFRRPVSPSM